MELEGPPRQYALEDDGRLGSHLPWQAGGPDRKTGLLGGKVLREAQALRCRAGPAGTLPPEGGIGGGEIQRHQYRRVNVGRKAVCHQRIHVFLSFLSRIRFNDFPSGWA